MRTERNQWLVEAFERAFEEMNAVDREDPGILAQTAIDALLEFEEETSDDDPGGD